MVTDAPPPTPRDLGCFWHGEEPIPEGAYLVCAECGHCYVTADDLLVAHREMRKEIGLPPHVATPSEILYCPLCAHDF
jgi:hypothetical protein